MSSPQPQPHVLIFPFPALAHVNSMLKLAELLSFSGLRITFLNSEYNHRRLTLHTDVVSLYTTRFPHFTFRTISDGLPPEHPRVGDKVNDLLLGFKEVAPPLFKKMLIDEIEPAVDFIIADGYMSFALDVGDQVGVPVFHFRTINPAAFWSYFCVPEMIDAGELPIKGKDDMDRLVTNVPGMETYLRYRDLPSFCRADDTSNPLLQLIWNETRSSARAPGLILNTFDDLDQPILSHIREHCPNLYTIGPLQAQLKSRSVRMTDSINNFYKVDKSCITWLDKQVPKSVLYVSFGTITTLPNNEIMELWHGLVDSKQPFLWVVRPGLVSGEEGEDKVPDKLIQGTKERGYMVEWAPQEEVLAHPAVGGFLTHCGWNSTLESIVAGQPMICWPYFADQQINSRLVSEVWKLGLDMKDVVCVRRVVEEMVREVMVQRKEEFMKSAESWAALARNSVVEGGSSHSNLDRLISDIKIMSSQ